MKTVIRLFVFGLVLILLLSISIAIAAEKPDGKPIFVENKCTNCHSISAHKIEKKAGATSSVAAKAPDLSGLGLVRTEEFIAKWLKKEETINGKKHVATFKGSDEDVVVLSAWLASLKKADKAGKADAKGGESGEK